MAADEIDELRNRIADLEEDNRHYAAAIDDLQRFILQMATDFRELYETVRASETRTERSATQINIISRTVANLLARVERLEHPDGGS